MQPHERTITRLDPAEAEIVFTGDPPPGGRVMGPRCAYASTVEVAYRLTPRPGGARVVIPEPSFWDPQTPLLYEAVVGEIRSTIGLRTVRLGPAGLRVNRRPFRIEGAARTDLSDAAALRAIGIDTILCPVGPATAHIWAEADRLGFFVLGMVPRDPEAVGLARELKHHASCLGWLLDDADLLEPQSLQTVPGHEPLLGWRADTAPPPWAQFVAGPDAPADSPIPWLLLDDRGDRTPGPLGVIRR